MDTKTELKELIDQAVSKALAEQQQKNFIKGIHQLAAFLQVSPARAQKMKNEGLFPFWQDGRTLLFDPKVVREVMFNKG